MDICKTIENSIETKAFPIEIEGFYIGGQIKKPRSGKTVESINPSTSEVLTSFKADKELYKEAIDFGYENADSFSDLTFEERIADIARLRSVLTDRSEIIEKLLRCEAGKPKWEAQQDIEACLTYLTWVSENHKLIFEKIHSPAFLSPESASLLVEPVGLTVGYLPFSTPLCSFILYLSNTIISGCPLVLVTSRHVSLLGQVLSEVCGQANLNKAAIQVLSGDFGFFKSELSSEKVRAVLYTGSQEHCETIRRESQTHKGRQLILQSGGKNSVLVDKSCDLDLAVKSTLISAFKGAGQQCSSASQLFVHNSIKDQFSELLGEGIKNLRIGPTHENTQENIQMGPMMSNKSVGNFLKFQTMAHREASETLMWGKAIEGLGGFFVSPGLHIIKDFDPSCAYQSNVLFCPDLALYSYDSVEEACDQINTTRALLSTSIMADSSEVMQIAKHLKAPNIHENGPTVETSASLTLAGRRQASTHRYSGLGISIILSQPKVVKDSGNFKGLLSCWP